MGRPFYISEPVSKNDKLTPEQAREIDELAREGRKDTRKATPKSAAVVPMPYDIRHNHNSKSGWEYARFSDTAPHYHVWRCITREFCTVGSIYPCRRRQRAASECSVCVAEGEAL